MRCALGRRFSRGTAQPASSSYTLSNSFLCRLVLVLISYGTGLRTVILDSRFSGQPIDKTLTRVELHSSSSWFLRAAPPSLVVSVIRQAQFLVWIGLW
jgi:hypothetical protein